MNKQNKKLRYLRKQSIVQNTIERINENEYNRKPISCLWIGKQDYLNPTQIFRRIHR